MPGNHVISLIPGSHLIMYLKMDLKILRLYLVGIVLQEIPHIYYPRHNIGGYGFRDLAVLKKIRHRLAGVIVPLYLVNHGKVGSDIIPQPVIGFNIQIDHFLDMEYIVGNIIDYIA